ncbi:ATP-binding protein [Tenacibaculum xiamenense]|uniref:ATP-binding protein n=1 Tax=Tenacibaculum xiamenense TaxID=1261553 RepID=UPI0038933915
MTHYCLYANLNITDSFKFFKPQSSSIKALKYLNKKTWIFYEQKNDSALFFAKRALELASELNNTSDLFISYIQLAEIYRSKRKLKQAQEYLDFATKLLDKVPSLTDKRRYFLYFGKLAYNKRKYKIAKEHLQRGTELEHHTSSALMIDLYMYLSKIAVKERNYSEAIGYLEDALELAEQIKKSKKPSLLNNLGNIYARQQLYTKAKTFYEQSLKAAKLQSDTKAQGRAYLNIGNILYYKGNWNSAISWYLKSIEIKESLNDLKGIAKIHSNIAAIYKQHKRYEESLRYFKMSESYFLSAKDSIKLAETWMNKATLTILLKEPNKALPDLHKALFIFKKNGLKKNQQLTEYNIALALTKLKEYKKAIHYLEKAKKKALLLNEKHSLIYITNLYGVCYFELGNHHKAIPYYKRSYNLSKEIGTLHEQKTALFGLYEVTEVLGNFNQSLQWHKQYSILKDSLFNTANNTQLLALQEKYEAKLKEQEILNLKSDNEKISLENSIKKGQLRISLLGVIIGVLATISVSLLFYQRNKNQKALLLRTREKNEEQINKLIQEQQIQTLETVLKAQEEERKKIAKDIHDNLGSYLATIKYQHEANRPVMTYPEENTNYSHMSQLIEDTYSEIRSISHRMATGQGFDFCLSTAIESSLDRIKATKRINVHFENLTNNYQFSQETELGIYNIIQELLSNTLKHSQATELIIQINNDSDYLSIIVEDNGVGFNTEEESKGIGISNIFGRIENLNGQIEISSNTGKGTTTLIRVPITKTIEYEC